MYLSRKVDLFEDAEVNVFAFGSDGKTVSDYYYFICKRQKKREFICPRRSRMVLDCTTYARMWVNVIILQSTL